ncbi:hypothetical protein EVAR_50725_1 [Eumeta japonica]|uniref:Uncharacterized protein n=1 Tax=Eumeta variegata TaxID=151549 RepID=A0A4C1YQW0_EUMVA|nr:hypothetical protein EVAR_50725_1 [Eumeta japonica]
MIVVSDDAFTPLFAASGDRREYGPWRSIMGWVLFAETRGCIVFKSDRAVLKLESGLSRAPVQFNGTVRTSRLSRTARGRRARRGHTYEGPSLDYVL